MRDLRPGTTPQKAKPKPKAAVLGPGLSGEHGAAPESPKPRFTGHDEPPHPVLKAAGFVGSILDFNDHVAQIAAAHSQTFGYDPPAGLALDIARSGLQPVEYAKLFPSDSKRAYGLAQKYGHLESDEDRLLGELKQAVASGDYEDWMRDNGGNLAELGQDNPDFARKYAPLVMRGQKQHYSGISMSGGTLFNALGFTAKAVEQVATGLTVGPAVFAWEEGRASYHDVGALVHGNLPTHLAKTNVKLAKGVAHGIKEDVTHPGDNAGNLFLDALGLLSIGAGAVTRAGAVGRAARAGEGLRGAGKAAVRRPTAGTYEIQYGGSVASPLLSENSALRQVQKLFYGRVQKIADLKHQGVVPAGAADAVGKRSARTALSAIVHPLQSLPVEAFIRAEWKAQDRVLAAARQAVIAPVVSAGHWSIRTSFLPKLSKPLTVGEQKAIQVLLTDIEGPFRNQFDVQRNFHESMIEAGIGERAAHSAQLEALTLAESVMSKKPRPEFAKALEDISRTVDVMEAIKKSEMGLLATTAEGRVAKAGQAFRGEELTGGEKVNPQSRYLPFVSATRKIGKPTDAGAYWNPTPGPFGIPMPGTDPSLTHQFTAHYIKSGDFRFDASNLAGEAYGRAVRSAGRLNAWKRLHDAAVDEHRPGYLPVRSERKISEPLREVMAKNENGPLTAEDLELLAPDGGDLDSFLFPDPKLTAVDDPTVRWVSPKLLESRRPPISPHFIKRVFTGVNEVLRDTILFAKPSYALNALGNAGMAALHQGPALIPNLIRAATANQRYGAEATRILDGLGGESRSTSYTPAGRKLSNKLAAGWNRLTDRVWRRAAVIHELRRAGIKERDIPRALEKYAKGEAGELAETIVEASRRAKKAMVELDNLTWFEKESLRHYVFVYPWVSRSLVWSIRTIFEHPIKSDLLAHVTADAEQDKALEHAPYWLKNLGYIPTGIDGDGNPKVAGFGSINTFVTLSEAMGLLSGKETLEETLGPGAELGLRLVTNKDRFGNEYETPVIGPITDSLIGLPQYRALARAQETGEPGAKPLDITNAMSLVEREHAALKGETKRSVFVPEGWAALWSLGIGGLHERAVDRAAIEARFWRDQPPEKRHKHEVELLNKMLREQAGFLKRPLPKDVREAVDFNFDREFAYKQFAKKNGRGPTQKERAQITIDMLEDGADISASEAKKLRAKLDSTKTPDLSEFVTGLLHHYAGGKALVAWRQDVETVASVGDRRLLDYYIGNGVDAGVVDAEYRNAANAPDGTLQELGRRYLQYEDEIQKRQDAMDGKKRGEKTLLSLQLREWIDQQDQPVTINGHKFPPLPRLAVARMNRDQLRAHLIDVSLSSWEGLSVIDKELAGRKSSPEVATAWAEYKIGLAKAVAKLPPGERRLDADQKLAVVKQVDRWYKLNGAFLRDYLFAQRPRISQMSELRIFTEAPPGAKQEFQYLVANARQLEIAEKDGNISRTDAKEVWRDWIGGLVVEGGYYQTEGIAFWRYVQPYVKRDPDFLYDLLN